MVKSKTIKAKTEIGKEAGHNWQYTVLELTIPIFAQILINLPIESHHQELKKERKYPQEGTPPDTYQYKVRFGKLLQVKSQCMEKLVVPYGGS